MRLYCCLLLGMLGLALAVPASVIAAPLDDDAAAAAAGPSSLGTYAPAASQPAGASALPAAGSAMAATAAPAALAQPASSVNLEFEPGSQPWLQPQPKRESDPRRQVQSLPHSHRGLFGRRHCAECQRASIKAHDGVDIPPPPPIAAATMMHGQVLTEQAMAEMGPACPTCQGHVVVSEPVVADSQGRGYTMVGGSGVMVNAGVPSYSVVGGPAAMASADAAGYAVVGGPGGMASGGAPGYAVVGGPGAVASGGAPGYAVVNEAFAGQEPAPIGVSRSALGRSGDPRQAVMGPRQGAPGRYDASVVPTSVPPAQVAQPDSEPRSRLKIIAHAIGVPSFGSRRRAEAEKERQKHASISYEDANSKVTELPASMVYGKGDH